MREMNHTIGCGLRSPAILIVLLPLLLFGRALRPGRVLSSADILFVFPPWHQLDSDVTPGNGLLSDPMFQFQPWLIYADREIHAGRFPLWNPDALAGAPLLGNAQSAVMFPLSWLAYLFPLPTALGLAAIAKLLIAGLGMYWMLRVLGLRALAATAGALAFMFNGFLVVWLEWPVSSVGVFLPLLVGLIERLRRSLSWRYAGGLALVIGIQFLGGHPETSFHILFVAACYGIYRMRGVGGMGFLAKLATAGALGVLLAGLQLLPFFEYLSHSAIFFFRAQGVRPGLPLRAALVFLMPNYFGTPVHRNFWGPGNYNEIAGSVGVLPLIVASCALLGGWHRRGTGFFFALAIFSGAAIYGFWPVPWLLSKVPGFSRDVNSRLLLALDFGLAALGGRA
jgi:hypothetical protein